MRIKGAPKNKLNSLAFKILSEVSDNNPSEVLTALFISCTFVMDRSFEEKDLERARVVIDSAKSIMLNELSERGWK